MPKIPPHKTKLATYSRRRYWQSLRALDRVQRFIHWMEQQDTLRDATAAARVLYDHLEGQHQLSKETIRRLPIKDHIKFLNADKE